MSEKDKALNRKLVQDISLDKEKEQVDTAIESLQDLEAVSYTHLDVYKRQLME